MLFNRRTRPSVMEGRKKSFMKSDSGIVTSSGRLDWKSDILRKIKHVLLPDLILRQQSNFLGKSERVESMVTPTGETTRDLYFTETLRSRLQYFKQGSTSMQKADLGQGLGCKSSARASDKEQGSICTRGEAPKSKPSKVAFA